MKPTLTIEELLREATERLHKAMVQSSRLDAELLCAHALKVDRTWLHAHGDTAPSSVQSKQFSEYIQRRLNHEPIAYITGTREFYGRIFKVNSTTLIPRPESETLIAQLNTLFDHSTRTLLDVGTGSGCLGITAKLEHPPLDVTMSDISEDALLVAQANATMHHAEVATLRSNLLSAINGTFDVIIANLPYVDRAWETMPDIAHEPQTALYADDNGLALIKQLLDQATTHLSIGGHILLEADPCQHESIVAYASELGFHRALTDDYVVVLSH